jgi:hypothetical protein
VSDDDDEIMEKKTSELFYILLEGFFEKYNLIFHLFLWPCHEMG